MVETLISALVGALVPTIAYIIKRTFIDKKFSEKDREVIINDSKGVSSNIIINGEISVDKIKDHLNEIYNLEKELKKALDFYKKSNSKIVYKNNKFVDYIVEHEGKIIGIEAKTSKNIPSKSYLENLKKEHPEIDDLIYVFNSKVPQEYLSKYQNNNKIKFISSPNGKQLKEKITNILNSEFRVDKA